MMKGYELTITFPLVVCTTLPAFTRTVLGGGDDSTVDRDNGIGYVKYCSDQSLLLKYFVMLRGTVLHSQPSVPLHPLERPGP
jgi:hypothetical protein